MAEAEGQKMQLVQEGRFSYHHGKVVATFPLTESFLDVIFAQGEDDIDFARNAHRIFESASGSLNEKRDDQDYVATCRKGSNCPAVVGCSYDLGGSAESDRQKVGMWLNVSCERAMTSANDITRMGEAPVVLGKIGGAGRKNEQPPLYHGVREFDLGCYIEMGAMTTLLSEMMAEAIKEEPEPPPSNLK